MSDLNISLDNTYLDDKGYYRLKGSDRLVHRVVMEWMSGRPITSEEIVDHIDGNRTNNLPENLRLCADRWEHAERSGLTVHGEKLPHWKPKAHKKGGHKARR